MRPRKTILCVEDNEQILSVRKFLLETRGYRVLGMGTAAEALEYLQGVAQGSVDLLLADLILPQMDGNELIRRAKQVHPGLPTLLVSGTVTNFDRAAAADAFLPKGACTPAEVLDRIRILVARKRGPKKRCSRWVCRLRRSGWRWRVSCIPKEGSKAARECRFLSGKRHFYFWHCSEVALIVIGTLGLLDGDGSAGQQAHEQRED